MMKPGFIKEKVYDLKSDPELYYRPIEEISKTCLY